MDTYSSNRYTLFARTSKIIGDVMPSDKSGESHQNDPGHAAPVSRRDGDHAACHEELDRIAALRDRNESLLQTLHTYEQVDTAAQELIAVVDRHGILRFASPVFEKAYGLESGTANSRHLSDLIDADTYETLVKSHLELALTGETVSFEAWFNFPGLGRSCREVSFLPVAEDDTGDVIIFFADITKRVQTEQKLESREQQYRNVLESMQDGLGIVDPEGRLLYVNKRFCELVECGRDGLIGTRFEDLLDEESRESFLLHQKARRRGIANDYRISLRGKDGDKRTMLTRGQPLYDSEGNFAGSLGLLKDITKRIEAEDALHESLRFSRSILDSLVSHVVVLDKDGVITDVNRAWQEFAAENKGHGPAVEIGTNYLEQCRAAMASDNEEDAAYAKEALAGIEQVLSGSQPLFSMEYPCSAPDNPRWFMMRVTALQTEAGGAVITHMDVTQERLANEELEHTRNKLEDSVRVRTKDLTKANVALRDAYQDLLQANEQLRQEIEQRHKVEQDLALSEHRYKVLYENAADGILIFDDAGCVVETNAQFRRMIGRDADALLGVHISTFVDPEQLAVEPLHMEELLAGQKVLSERNLIAADGQKVPSELSTKRIADNIILAIIRDVSEKRRSEQAMRQNEKRYRSLFEDNIMILLLVDPDTGMIIDANSTASSFYGIPREDMTRTTMCDLSTDSTEHVLGNLQRALRGTGHRFVCHNRRADGDIRNVEIFGGPHLVNNRELVLAIVHDITRRMRAEALAREKEALLQHILSLMKIGIFVINQEDHTILEFNKVSSTMFLLPARKEVLGKDCLDVLFPLLRDATTHKKLDRKDLEPSNAHNREVFLAPHESHSSPVLYNAFPLKHEEKRNIILTFLDITDRKELERQLTHAQKLESIGQLAAGIAHEINTPTQYVSDNTRFIKDSFDDLLTLVERLLEFLETCKTEGGENETTRAIDELEKEIELEFLREEVPKAIDQSLEGLERISSIVLAMKKFSHPGESGMRPLDINDALENTIMVSRNEWKYVADVETEFDASLDPVLCYPDDLNQVFLNVIVNAAHAIGDKVQGTEEKGRITLGTRDLGESVEITIADTGTGIPEGNRTRLFDPFFTTKKVGKGTGQGLSISYSVVVDKHRGEIFFDSVDGEGTTFHIRIPKKARGNA